MSDDLRRRLLNAFLAMRGRKLVHIGLGYTGLGNRLKLMASYHVHFGLDGACLEWGLDPWVSAPFHDLFELDGIAVTERLPGTPLLRLPPLITYPTMPEFGDRGYWRLQVRPEWVDDACWVVRDGRRYPAVDFLYERTPPEVRRRYLEFFRRLRPSAAVRARLRDLVLPDDVVRVQVRNSLDKNDRANVPDMASFVEAMQRYPHDTTFFVSAMDRVFSDRLRRDFGDRIVELPGKDYGSMTDAVADLFLLAGGTTILASLGSTFPELAWWIGRCEAEVVTIEAVPFGSQPATSDAAIAETRPRPLAV